MDYDGSFMAMTKAENRANGRVALAKEADNVCHWLCQCFEEMRRSVVCRLAAKHWQSQWHPVSGLEREIDEIVYALYGLTPEEIELVEGRARK
ncbi:MAG: hypothetical protein IT426_02170 [Pirellulales bacterium]|nr:hypothetical protein [Pirellulales bacterium]